MIPIKSIFADIAETIFAMKNFGEARTFITEYVTAKKINEKDKQTILSNVNKCLSITKLQSYICNSLLQYEGLKIK